MQILNGMNPNNELERSLLFQKYRMFLQEIKQNGVGILPVLNHLLFFRSIVIQKYHRKQILQDVTFHSHYST